MQRKTPDLPGKGQTLMASDILIYDSISKSNIPQREKSTIQSWVDSVTGLVGSRSPYSAPAGHLAGFIGSLRQYSEGVGVGMLFGGLHAELKNGLDVGGVPVDAATGFISGGLALLFSGSEIAGDFNNVGSHATCVYGFRMVHKLRAEMLRAKGRVPGGTVSGVSTKPSNISGEDENDPIVQAARAMGRS